MKVGWTASGGQYLGVKDNGSGIAEDEIPIVLASFGQGSNSIKSAEQGAGLGLPIAKSLIDMHGGTLHPAIQAPYRHRGYRHLSAGARDVRSGADGGGSSAASTRTNGRSGSGCETPPAEQADHECRNGTLEHDPEKWKPVFK